MKFIKDKFVKYYLIIKNGSWHWHDQCQHMVKMNARVVGGTGFIRVKALRYPIRPFTSELCNECLAFEKKDLKP